MKTKKIIISIILINIAILLLLVIKPIKVDSGISSINGKEIYISNCINKKSIYKNKFTANVSNLKGIGIPVATYLNKNEKGTINLKLYDSKNSVIYNKNIPAKDFIDNEEFKFYFKEQKDSLNKEYTLEFSYSEFKDNCIAYKFVFETENPTLTENNNKTNQAIQIIEYGKKKDLMAYWYPLVIIAICTAAYSCIGDSNDEKNTK